MHHFRIKYNVILKDLIIIKMLEDLFSDTGEEKKLKNVSFRRIILFNKYSVSIRFDWQKDKVKKKKEKSIFLLLKTVNYCENKSLIINSFKVISQQIGMDCRYFLTFDLKLHRIFIFFCFLHHFLYWFCSIVET